MIKLFPIRQTFIFFLLAVAPLFSKAQLADKLVGQRRDVVQVYLSPYRIIDYKKERVVHNIEAGIHQTVLYEGDTCTKFYWAVTPDKIDKFKAMLSDAGYSANATGFAKDSLELLVKPLNSGKATLFIASISENLKGERYLSGAPVVRKQVAHLEELPLLQQAILAEERDTTAKPPKDPSRHWVGGKYGNASILGW